MLTVINKDGTFDGTQYSEIKQSIIDHHHQYGQKLIWIDRILEADEDGSVAELPTKEDLKREIVREEDYANKADIENLKVEQTMGNMETLKLIEIASKSNKQNQSEMMMEIMNLISQLQGGN